MEKCKHGAFSLFKTRWIVEKQITKPTELKQGPSVFNQEQSCKSSFDKLCGNTYFCPQTLLF